MDLEKKRLFDVLKCTFRFLILFLLLGMLSCATSRVYWPETPPSSYFASTSLETAYPDAEAIVLLDEAYVEVFPREKYSFSEYTRHTVIKILKETGFKYANVLIPYQGEEKVTHIQARTILPGGRIISLSPDRIFDTHFSSEPVFYSDMRAKKFALPGVEKGCIVEYTWQKTVGSFTLWTRWDFQYPIPVILSRYTLRCPSEWKVQWRTYGREISPKIEKMPSGMKADRIWELENIPPFFPESAMPPEADAPIRLLFSPVGIENWQDVGLWFFQLCEGQLKANQAMQNKVRELTSALEDPKEKLRAIFEFVRDEIRYIAIEIGIGRYQPHKASEVFAHRYGDCKDMMAVLISMAKEVGMKVYPVFLLTRQQGLMDTTLVTPAGFNHAIALAEFPDGTRIWMDPTDKGCAFGELPWYDQQVWTLVVRENGKSEFIQTPMVSADRNRVLRQWHIQVDSNGTGRGEVFMQFEGAQAIEMRNLFRRLTSREIKHWWSQQLLYRFPHVRCDSLNMMHLAPSSKPLYCWIGFSSIPFFTPEEKRMAFRPGDMALYDWHSQFPEPVRKFPVVLSYPVYVEDVVRLTLPKGWKLATASSGDSLSFGFGSYVWKGGPVASGEFGYTRMLSVRVTQVAPEEYDRFRFFLNEVANQDRRVFFFEPAD